MRFLPSDARIEFDNRPAIMLPAFGNIDRLRPDDRGQRRGDDGTMVESRWQIVVGAAILLLMLLAGAFYLGVYVGEHHWMSGEVNIQPNPGGTPPGGPPVQDQIPGQGQLPGPADGRPTLVGRIRSVSSAMLELATQEGPRRVGLHDGTVYLELDGPPLLISDLEEGDLVAIYGEMIAGEGGRLMAKVVERLPPRPPTAP